MIAGLARALVYANLFVAGVLGALTWATYAQIDSLKAKPFVPLTVFLGSFVLYVFHRLYKIDFIPRSQLADRHVWVMEHSNWMKLAMVFGVFLLLLLIPNYKADTVVWLIPAGIVSVGYTVPMLPTADGWRRFRDIPLSKPLIIAAVVTYLTFCFPLFEQQSITALGAREVWPLMLDRFLFVLVVTIPFDMRDIANDRDAGIRTLGTDFGFSQARKVAFTAASAWLASILISLFLEMVAPAQSFGAMMVWSVVFVALMLLRPNWRQIDYVWVFEGAIGLYAALSLLAADW
jgi:4-hydroxybenzoate polyprenyltransferase